jgi:transposase-like protein
MMTEEAKRVVPKELIDSLLAGYKKPEDLIGENGLLKQLTKLLVEKALDAEMTEHLGHDKNHPTQNRTRRWNIEVRGNLINGPMFFQNFFQNTQLKFNTVIGMALY